MTKTNKHNRKSNKGIKFLCTLSDYGDTFEIIVRNLDEAYTEVHRIAVEKGYIQQDENLKNLTIFPKTETGDKNEKQRKNNLHG